MPGNEGLLGWAMSSLTLKGKPSQQAPVASANSGTSLISASSNASSVIETPSTMPIRHVSSGADLADQPVPEYPTSTDGWVEIENGIDEDHDSDKDGWDDIEPLEEPLSSPTSKQLKIGLSHSLLHGQNRRQRPAPKTPSKPLHVKLATALDDDDQPWAVIAFPPPTTRAKPLAASRGRGAKPAAPKLGVQRMNRTSSSGM